jgi:hypothetical protein
MFKIVIGIVTIALLAYNDWELLSVLHSHVMEMIK